MFQQQVFELNTYCTRGLLLTDLVDCSLVVYIVNCILVQQCCTGTNLHENSRLFAFLVNQRPAHKLKFSV
jgi:hypothetical protein